MGNVAKNITNLRPPEQDFGQNEPQEPWLRQKNEPAAWYMRFKRYLDMGSKRSLRAVVASESGTQVNTKEGKKLSDVSVPRAWRRASRLWRWVERTAAYDLAQMDKRAAQIRKMAATTPYASKAYRILQLNFIARLLRDQVKPGMTLDDCLALVSRYQSVLHQIEREMQGIDETTQEMCDASAMLDIRKEIVDQEYDKKMKETIYTHEKNKIAFDRAEALAKLEKQRP